MLQVGLLWSSNLVVQPVIAKAQLINLPSYDGMAARAAIVGTSCGLYLQSITNPTAYVVEGITPLCHKLLAAVSERQLGDIIAYLLTPTAH
jgi:hypothetical protein